MIEKWCRALGCNNIIRGTWNFWVAKRFQVGDNFGPKRCKLPGVSFSCLGTKEHAMQLWVACFWGGHFHFEEDTFTFRDLGLAFDHSFDMNDKLFLARRDPSSLIESLSHQDTFVLVTSQDVRFGEVLLETFGNAIIFLKWRTDFFKAWQYIKMASSIMGFRNYSIN